MKLTEKEGNRVVLRDSFGFEIDPVVSFARGSIIRSSTDEGRRLRHGQAVAAKRVRELGADSIGIFTGNQRDFLVKPEDLNTACEEWVGPGLVAERLSELALDHLGGGDGDSVATFNRTSAAIVSVIAALAADKPVVSVVPPGGRSHASVNRGAKLAGVKAIEIQGDAQWRAAIELNRPALVVITTVTSSLERMDDEITQAIVTHCRRNDIIVFLDEAYGARLRTVLHGGIKSLAFGADLTVTNCDKAGLPGPRAGILAGKKQYIAAAAAKGAEYGMEARAPITAGVVRSLEHYNPDHLRQEAEAGQELASGLSALLGDCVKTSDLGPMVHEDQVLEIILKRACIAHTDNHIVPCEATAALGMVLLRDFGILTVNTHGQPGARVSLRLKPASNAIDRVGGINAIMKAVNASLDKVALLISDKHAMAELILGEPV
ncbi:aminotransferase class I/II-fold pyridoxal phosphate-dependent enzyme [Pantoea sp. Acro-805]|uniref:Aminotransferase class I/II-fold pyridoxal phosphate-dependent enzyme n=1 Tax=Candidatus Pantoea formicae TaxID=2608355 RepID=A0ABX0QZY3_9GAMM|nr:aminotransferase class I/II-fold pyridoxal phosphate-dependent enzyme [Pantoea formicae]MDF7649987.1 aminotransferase class I/II-fold pyridoxal phosphate-dependent enzyme [Erwiniaceae bacterium L1_54_3]NIF02495.1 aminotransferase class I/II-fold pyridoxal phosphate-dependent enzyme [Pantoea formicae]